MKNRFAPLSEEEKKMLRFSSCFQITKGGACLPLLLFGVWLCYGLATTLWVLPSPIFTI